MRVGQVLVTVAMVVIGLASCRGESPNVMGSYGGGTLSGSLVLNGIEGSPEGVEVSVRDTGMLEVLGPDGRFAFAGLPENAILDFRRGDGLQGSISVSGSKGSILVELGRSGAKSADRGKDKGNSGRDKRELEGVIRSTSADEIVLFTSHNEEVTVALTAETIIRQGNETLTPADLAVDMRVHVRARKVEDAYTALLVIVQEGEDDAKEDKEKVAGTVVRVAGSNITVATKSGEMTVQTDAATRIRNKGKTIGLSEIVAGDPVSAKGRRVSKNTILATEVEVRGKSGHP